MMASLIRTSANDGGFNLGSHQLPGSTEMEESICFLEPLAFFLWRKAAGRAVKSSVAEQWSFVTADGCRLWGHRLPATGKARSFLLVALGNAMLAEQVAPLFQLAGSD